MNYLQLYGVITQVPVAGLQAWELHGSLLGHVTLTVPLVCKHKLQVTLVYLHPEAGKHVSLVHILLSLQLIVGKIQPEMLLL